MFVLLLYIFSPIYQRRKPFFFFLVRDLLAEAIKRYTKYIESLNNHTVNALQLGFQKYSP